MKIINIGILAHVDAGKTTLTESLLYTSGAIMEPGSVDKGTTRTDSMALERQRKITIQAAVTSFRWKGYKVNLVDTPGHMDFLTEVHRSLSVLDGAILVVSAKDGVQAQTRVLFHALRKMKIPTIIFINKIDQSGVVLEQTYQNIREKLTEDMMVMQEVHLFSELTLSDVADFEKWDAVIAGNDNLLEKYLSGAPLTLRELQEEIKRRVQQGTFFPVYHGSAKENIGTKKLLDVITDIFSSKTDNCQSELCGYVFKIEYTEQKKRRCYLRLYSGTLCLRETILLSKKEKIKITEMSIPFDGEIVPTDTADSGEIVILSDNTLKLNDVLGDEKLLPLKAWTDSQLLCLPIDQKLNEVDLRQTLYAGGIQADLVVAEGNGRLADMREELTPNNLKFIKAERVIFLNLLIASRYSRQHFPAIALRSFHLLGRNRSAFWYASILEIIAVHIAQPPAGANRPAPA